MKVTEESMQVGFGLPSRIGERLESGGHPSVGTKQESLNYLACALEVYEAAQAIAVGLSAAVAIASTRNALLLELQSHLDSTQSNYEMIADEAQSARVPVCFRHDHDHLLAALHSLGTALVTARRITMSNIADELDQVVACLKVTIRELKRFDRTLPGYRLVGGCGCEVARQAFGADLHVAPVGYCYRAE
ncbi:hypothetical protein [Paraburkholderia phenoliruptrix]|uniref:hypothetical protein n=1 Tax=Paraburkholderia phenoliruptrix TaxID=252970 RepID=UPI0028698F95|nr:hypothetical protein [Paraburkholderia phenoliruptrix]WMY09582.1 hypothetical protein P3F88_07400 [Paraburkholderia phenoliruptrix]